MQTCTTCGETKPLTDFHKRARSSTGYNFKCKSCVVTYRQGLPTHEISVDVHRCVTCGEAKPASDFARNRRVKSGLRSQCKDCARTAHRLWAYGITKEEFEGLLQDQGGGCYFCGNRHDDPVSMHLDHDHSCHPAGSACKKCIRSVLCSGCNMHLVSGYEALPVIVRTWPAMNEYLTRRPLLTV